MLDVRAMYTKLAVLLVALLCGGQLVAQEATLEKGAHREIPVRQVGNSLVALVNFSANGNYKEWAVLIDLDAPHKLALVGNAQGHLDLGKKSGPITMQFESGDKLVVPAADVQAYTGPVSAEQFSKFNIDELQQRPLAGSIGVALLKQFKVTLDANAGSILLESPSLPSQGISGLSGDLVVFPIRDEDLQTFVPIRYGNGQRGEMVLSSALYDTYIDSGYAKRLGAPAGNVGSVTLVGAVERTKIDLSLYSAFRPEAFYEEGVEPGSTVLISGLGLLNHFRIVLDWENRYATFTQVKSAEFPKQDLAFFKAQLVNSNQVFTEYLDQYPTERLSREAANQLLELRLTDGSNHDEIFDAIVRITKTARLRRITEVCQDVMASQAVSELPDNGELMVKIAELGLEHSAKSINAESSYAMHGVLAQLALDVGDLDKAWEHALSWSFGVTDPKDPSATYMLGKVYEAQGRYRRAYSRYKKALSIFPRHKDAKAALARLEDKVADEHK